MRTLKIRLVENRNVIHPDTYKKLVPDKTYTVPGVQYWLKRIVLGDIVEYKEIKKAKPKLKTKKQKTKKEPLKVEVEKENNSKEMGD